MSDKPVELNPGQVRVRSELQTILVHISATIFELETTGRAPWEALSRRLDKMAFLTHHQGITDRELWLMEQRASKQRTGVDA